MIELVFAPGTANERRVDLTKIGTNLNPVRTHSGVSDLRGTIRADRSLEEYAQRQDRVNLVIDGDTKWTGYAVGISHDKQQATTRISADGIEKRLEETRPDYDSLGGPLTYSSIALEDALRDYWARTPFENYSVTDQTTELVAEDALIQDADTTTEWANLTPEISDTDPLIIESDTLRLTQVNWLVEAENADSNGATDLTNDDYSGGIARGLPTTVYEISHTFTTEHTIPASSVAVNFRRDTRHDTERNHIPFDVQIDGETVRGYGQGSLADDLGWVNSVGISSDLEPGTHTVTLSPTSDPSDREPVYIDCLCLTDSRYNFTFDNSVHEASGYLDGPGLYPSGVSAETDILLASYNVRGSRLNTSWNDTTGAQALAVSNDGGSTYQSASNTQTIDKAYSNAGREVRAKFTFDRFGERDTETPRKGFNGQAVDLYEHYIDGDDLVVIDELELSRHHMDNLSTLHDYGDFLFVVEHSDSPISELPVHSFQRGDVSRPVPDGFDKQKNQQPEIQSGTYYNSIYLEGAKQDDGTRPSHEEKDQDAINEDGREISPGVLRDQTINTEAGAQFRARALLEAALANDEYVGQVIVPPIITDPGFAREVDFGNGPTEKTVEKVSLNISQGSADATFDFSSNSGIIDDLDSLKRNSRDQGDQV